MTKKTLRIFQGRLKYDFTIISKIQSCSLSQISKITEMLKNRMETETREESSLNISILMGRDFFFFLVRIIYSIFYCLTLILIFF